MTHFVTFADGVTAAIGKVPASSGLRASTILLGMLGPAARRLATEDGSLDAVVPLVFMQPQVGDRLLELVTLLGQATQLEGLPDTAPGSRVSFVAVFETYFAGNFDALITWLEAAVEVNCGSFFAGMRGLLTRLNKRAEEAAQAKASESPTP